jgi:hypothetical protein
MVEDESPVCMPSSGLKRKIPLDVSAESRNNIRSVTLGSRKQLCIHEDLRKRSTDLDESCRQLLNGELPSCLAEESNAE